MHLGLNLQAFCAPYSVLGYSSPVILAKFQMAPMPSSLISFGSKKKEPRYACLSQANASHSQYEPWTYFYKVKEGSFVLTSRVSVCNKLLDFRWLFVLSIDDFYQSSCSLLGARGGATVHCATSREIAGSIPDGNTGIFHWHNRSGRTVALASTQPLTEMSTRNIQLGYKNQSVYAVSGTSRCLFSDKYKTHKYSVGRAYSCWMLTLRLLMSYIYIYMEHPILMFLDHTQRRTTVGRTPLDEWSARRRDLYLTTRDTHNRQISATSW